MIIKPPVPRLEFLFHAKVEVAAPRVFGKVASGERRVIDILGGRIEGPRLTGEILPGGADWQIVQDNGVAVLDARYTVRALDGGLIYVQNRGVRHGPAEVMARIGRGEPVDPATYYFRSAPVFETAAPAHLWMNSIIAVCSAARTPDRVILDFYGVY